MAIKQFKQPLNEEDESRLAEMSQQQDFPQAKQAIGNNLKPVQQVKPVENPYQKKYKDNTSDFFQALTLKYGDNPQFLSKLREYGDQDEETFNLGQEMYEQIQAKYGIKDEDMDEFWNNALLMAEEYLAGR